MAVPAHVPPAVRAALAEARERLAALYGDRLARVVLYGSHTRGDARPDSDVDLLVVLRGAYDPYAELKAHLVPVSLDLLDRFGVDLSAQPFGEHEVADVRRPFMRQVGADGVDL